MPHLTLSIQVYEMFQLQHVVTYFFVISGVVVGLSKTPPPGPAEAETACIVLLQDLPARQKYRQMHENATSTTVKHIQNHLINKMLAYILCYDVKNTSSRTFR